MNKALGFPHHTKLNFAKSQFKSGSFAFSFSLLLELVKTITSLMLSETNRLLTFDASLVPYVLR